MLTAARLREAATHIGPTYQTGERFMCFAVSNTLFNVPTLEAQEISKEFYRLLQAHGVGTSGNLWHRGEIYVTKAQRQTQKLRFDFLQLLACSLEKP